VSAGDTIFARATGAGRAAVAVLRVSGPHASEVLRALAGGLPPPRVASLRRLCDADGEALRLLLGVGVLGGFTTFSAFSLEVFTMIVRGDTGLAGAYALSSVAGAVLAVMTGVWLARA
jgi:CrcB protein